MTEPKPLPVRIKIPDEYARQLERYNVEPETDNIYFVYALLEVFRNLEKQADKRKKDTDKQPEWLPLFLFLQTLFSGLANQALIEQPTKEKPIKEKKPAPSTEPLYEDLAPFWGKPVTMHYGPYALPTGVFNALRWNLYTSKHEPTMLMANEIAELSEADLYRMFNIKERAVEFIKALLERIQFESAGGIAGNPFIIEVPSLYFDVFSRELEFPRWLRPKLEELNSRYVPGMSVSDGESVDLYTLACLTQVDFSFPHILGKTLNWKDKAAILKVLQRHANDIYLKK